MTVRRVRKIAKSDPSFVMSVRPSVHPSFRPSVFRSVRPSAWNNSAPTGRIFVKFDIQVLFENLWIKINFY